MNDTIETEVRALSKATPITIGLMIALLTVTSVGSWYASRFSYELQSVKGKQDENTMLIQSVMTLTEKMDRRIEWIEKTQGKQ